jgi:predicted nucleic acid-binding protein
MTASKVFIDTNVLVYAFDMSEPVKAAIADSVLNHLGPSRRGVVSAQVIAEFVSATTRKLRAPLLAMEPEAAARSALAAFEVAEMGSIVAHQTLRGWRRYGLSYWDAQIWATARQSGIDRIVSEDCPAPELEGVRYINPFAEGFRLEDLDAEG